MTDMPALAQTANQVAQELAATPWYAVILPHWSTALGAVLFLYVCGRQLADRRPPGNILAWGLLILLSPLFGLFCFILIGERKRHKMRTLRLTVARLSIYGANAPVAAPALPTRFLPMIAADSVSDYALIVDQVSRAQRHILITSYLFDDDATGRDLVARLAARAQAGVMVRVLIDALGSRGTGDDLFAPLVAAGGQFARFMPVSAWRIGGAANLRNHRKLMIFDGMCAVIGGRNIGEAYLGPTPLPGRYRDFALLIEGAGIHELTRVFASDWCFTAGEDPRVFYSELGPRSAATIDPAVEVVAGGPDQVNDPIWEKLVTLLAQAREEIVIVTPYLVPDEVLLRLLAAKARAGVRIRIITPRRSDHRIADFARRHHVRVLREAGAEVFYYDAGFLHGKLVLVDRATCVIGSANFDMRSLFLNFELATVIHDRATAAGFAGLAEELIAVSKPANRHRTRAAGWFNRAAEALAHLMAPLL